MFRGMRDPLCGYGIVTPGVPGVTLRQSSEREGYATKSAMAFDSFLSVLRTTRIEPAIRPEKRTQEPTIEFDHRDQDRAHIRIATRQCSSRRRARFALVASRAPPRALRMMSAAGKSLWWARKDSRIKRLMRLRWTAVLIRRAAMASPRRG